MNGEPKIVTHADPVDRNQANYIHRLVVDREQGEFEQVWTHTTDQQTFKLCCIPFFPRGLSRGDHLSIEEDGSFAVVRKGGHQTIRVVILDAEYAHTRHDEFHDLIANTGARYERFGHASTYWALDVDDAVHAQRVIEALTPLTEAGTINWEWADPKLLE